jgi:hypothetical protein
LRRGSAVRQNTPIKSRKLQEGFCSTFKEEVFRKRICPLDFVVFFPANSVEKF